MAKHVPDAGSYASVALLVLRRPYQAPQTPLQRLVASGAADPVKLAELRQRDRLHPFQVSATIEAQRKKIFALSREAPSPSTTPAPVERALG
jgi:hypothetical protein